MRPLVLASSSPSRKAILEEAGISFVVDVSGYEEDMSLPLQPVDLAVFLSEGKAREVAPRHLSSLVLAADSFALLDGELLGKPHTRKRAQEMLTLLSGRSHTFVTGFTIIDTSTGKEYSEAITTKLYAKNLTKKDIENYLDHEDVLEKAGAYSIKGKDRQLFNKIEGSLDNVRGLPLAEVLSAIEELTGDRYK